MKTILKISALAVLLTSTGCGGGGSDANNNLEATVCPRVINGENCDPLGSPIVELNITSPKGAVSLCSGTVISSTKVLTAAHCFLTSNVASIVINNGRADINAVSYSIHPGVKVESNSIINDVAIVQAGSPINSPTLPILIGTTPQVGDMIGINGFGLDENGDLGTLKGGTMKISNVTANHVFAKYDGKLSNTCNGDSGGPATYTINGTVSVIGITSSGIKTDCSEGDETLFTNIQSSSVLDYLTAVAPEISIL
jgi:secreted trypsin-like serine protease